MFVTLDVFHPLMFWLNFVAFKNTLTMVVTLDVFHAPMSWLNTELYANRADMLVTLDVSHEPIGWLNATNKNIVLISVIRVVTILLNGMGDAPSGVNTEAAPEAFLA